MSTVVLTVSTSVSEGSRGGLIMRSLAPLETCLAAKDPSFVEPYLDVPSIILIVSISLLAAACTVSRWGRVRETVQGRWEKGPMFLCLVASGSALSMLMFGMHSEDAIAVRRGPTSIDCAAIPHMPRLRDLGNGNSWAEVYLSKLGTSFVVIKTIRTHPRRKIAPGRGLLVNSTDMHETPCGAEAYLRSEAAIARLFAGNPHVVQILGHCDATSTTVFEFYPSTLSQLLFNRDLCKEWSFELVLTLCLGVAKSVAELHAFDVVHGEINPGQFMIDAGGVVRVGDFHHSMHPTVGVTNDCKGMVGGRYVAPEQVRRETATPATDVYALGLMIWTIANRESAFENQTKEMVWEMLERGQRPDIPTTMDPELAKIAQSCWQESPKDRTDAGFVVRWLEGIAQKL
ncbi:hypothetical protein BSKO_00484 [Bryopsis sp. KO-2023]|nr:hypothetical protein BSKO_00484 [Bryopsis sp. KO-2023]